jgi:hypothetical protein
MAALLTRGRRPVGGICDISLLLCLDVVLSVRECDKGND